jgi:hypothetical protein
MIRPPTLRPPICSCQAGAPKQVPCPVDITTIARSASAEMLGRVQNERAS